MYINRLPNTIEYNVHDKQPRIDIPRPSSLIFAKTSTRNSADPLFIMVRFKDELNIRDYTRTLHIQTPDSSKSRFSPPRFHPCQLRYIHEDGDPTGPVRFGLMVHEVAHSALPWDERVREFYTGGIIITMTTITGRALGRATRGVGENISTHSTPYSFDCAGQVL